jgi:hypothetical protein
VIAYFTLHFTKTVNHPLKPLQDHLDKKKSLDGKDVFPDSLMLIGKKKNTRTSVITRIGKGLFIDFDFRCFLQAFRIMVKDVDLRR